MPGPHRPDNWSWLNRWIGDGFEEFPRHPIGWQLAASWVPMEDRRRLAAYTVCGAFLDGTMHYWQPYLDVKQRRKWREYGDAQLFATQARSSVIGEDQTISVEVDVDGDGNADAAGEAAREWLLDWADQESLTTRLLDAEYDAMGLGDAVYALGMSGDGTRPRLRVYDPGWYFPDPLSQGPDDDFPATVHVAWEEADPADPLKTLLRRRTWRLVDLEDFPQYEGRTYPWADGPATQTVLYWDGVWNLSDVAGANGLYKLNDDTADWQPMADGTPARAVDLGLDFIPVVHIPNGSPGKALWGRPVWWAVVRLLDDIAASDTDAQVGSEIYGSGALLSKGGGLAGGSTGPGSVFELPDTQTADARFVDMSAGMKAMGEYVNGLRDLASVNSRLPAEVLGRVKASEVPSGLALRLAFGPLASLVRELRQVRDDKYTLLLKFAMRLAQHKELLAPGPLPRAELKFGSFLPSDQAEAVSAVTELWDRPNPVISLETAIQMLVDAGFPIEDAHEELGRINRQAYGRAIQLLEATGSEVAVRALLNTGDQGKIPDAPVVTVLPVPSPAHKITEPNAAPPGSGNQPTPTPPEGSGP